MEENKESKDNKEIDWNNYTLEAIERKFKNE